MYLLVQEQEEANSEFKRFETYLRAPCMHRTQCAGAELGSFTYFSVCICICSFSCRRRWRKAQIGLAVCETWLYAFAPNTAREYSFELWVFCLNALNSFECLNWQGLKTRANEKLSWQHAAVAICSERLFRMASASRLIGHSVGHYLLILVLFQNFMAFFFLWNTRKNILRTISTKSRI